VAESQGDLVDEGREEDHHEDAEHRPDERGDDSGPDGEPSLALLRQGETVEACGCRRRGARDVDHDGRVEPSGNGADVDGEKKGHGVFQGHAVGEVDQQGKGHSGSEAGYGAYQEAEKAASENQAENCRVEGTYE